jgi:glycosyltransferase involved in cell wall biosynthesis
MPKVSVIIPAYNAMEYLPKTLESVLKQTFTDCELLIINDGSSDSILEWAAGLTEPRVKLISQLNQGVAVARNTGIAHAQGEYLAFLDADDLWEPTKLEKQVRCLENNPAVGLIYTWTALIDQSGKPTGRVFASHLEGNVWEHMIQNDAVCNGSSAMVRRCCFDTVGLFDQNVAPAEDYEMWIRIAARYPFAAIKEPLTLYRQHPHNATKNDQRMLQSLHKVIEKTFQSIPLDLLYLRNRAYANLFFGFAWLAVDQGDYKKAIYLRQQALLHHPQVRFSERCLRLNLAIAMTRWFGTNGYDGVRLLTHILRQRLLGIADLT